MFLCLVNTINKLPLHYTHVMKTVDDTCGTGYTHMYHVKFKTNWLWLMSPNNDTMVMVSLPYM